MKPLHSLTPADPVELLFLQQKYPQYTWQMAETGYAYTFTNSAGPRTEIVSFATFTDYYHLDYNTWVAAQ